MSAFLARHGLAIRTFGIAVILLFTRASLAFWVTGEGVVTALAVTAVSLVPSDAGVWTWAYRLARKLPTPPQASPTGYPMPRSSKA